MTTPLPIGLRRLMKLADDVSRLSPMFSVTVFQQRDIGELSEYFELSDEDAHELFMSDRLASDEFAAHIRRFVEGKVAK